MPGKLKKPEDVEILFAAEPAVYREGDLVTGSVKINIQKDVKYKGKKNRLFYSLSGHC